MEMGALFFLQAMATGMWMVPLSRVLTAHGMPQLRPYAFATAAVAAFVSPLIFGAMADRHAPPVRVLRWLSLASASGMALASFAISQRWAPGIVLALIQLYAVFAAPTPWEILLCRKDSAYAVLRVSSRPFRICPLPRRRAGRRNRRANPQTGSLRRIRNRTGCSATRPFSRPAFPRRCRWRRFSAFSP